MGSTRLAEIAGTETREGESEERIVPYRQSALDRLSSPEQLDQLLVATRPQGWLALGALLLLLASALVWASYGTVTTRITAEGIVSRSTPESSSELGSELRAVVFVPAAQALLVETGMEARVSPSVLVRGPSGSLTGTVTAVGDAPVSEALERSLGREDLVTDLKRKGPLIRVEIVLRPALPAGSEGSRNPSLRLIDGTRVNARIVVRKEHPIELLVPASWRSGEA